MAGFRGFRASSTAAGESRGTNSEGHDTGTTQAAAAVEESLRDDVVDGDEVTDRHMLQVGNLGRSWCLHSAKVWRDSERWYRNSEEGAF